MFVARLSRECLEAYRTLPSHSAGKDRLFAWSGGAAYGDNGRDELFQYAGSATLDGGNGGDTLTNGSDPTVDAVTLVGGRGSDSLVNDDATGTTAMDGGAGSDTCTAATSAVGCEA